MSPRAWSILATLNLLAEAGISDSNTRSNCPDSKRCDGSRWVKSWCQSSTRVDRSTVTILPPAEVVIFEIARYGATSRTPGVETISFHKQSKSAPVIGVPSHHCAPYYIESHSPWP